MDLSSMDPAGPAAAILSMMSNPVCCTGVAFEARLAQMRESVAARQPPLDRPWIVSAQRVIEGEEDERRECKRCWLEACPFPGVDACADAKIEWLSKIHKKCEEDDLLEESSCCQTNNVPEASEVAREVLRESCGEGGRSIIVVELLASVDHLRAIEMDPEDANRLYGGVDCWEDHRRRLLLESRPTIPTSSDPGEELVAIGSIECKPDDELIGKVKECTKMYGYENFVSFVKEVNRKATTGNACFQWDIQKLVGENLYAPRGPDDKRLGYSVHVGLKTPTARDRASNAFIASLDAKKHAARTAGDPKDYMLVTKAKPPSSSNKRGSNDSDDKEDEGDGNGEIAEKTADNYHVLWVPSPEYGEQNNRVRPHFLLGKGESISLQKRLLERGGNNNTNDAGNVKVQLFESELHYIKQLKSWREKLSAALALTQAAARDTCWIRDNECSPEEVAKLLKDLAAYWRTILLKKDDDALGIGLGRADKENGKSEEEKSESRLALESLLQLLTPRFEDASGDDVKVKFNWKLGHSRNPKRPNAQNKRRKTGEK